MLVIGANSTMKFRAITTLKKADTEGRVPMHTLDQYVRNELSVQLINAIKPNLAITSDSKTDVTKRETVDFTTEVLLLRLDQWQAIRSVLVDNIALLNTADQAKIRYVIDEVDKR